MMIKSQPAEWRRSHTPRLDVAPVMRYYMSASKGREEHAMPLQQINPDRFDAEGRIIGWGERYDASLDKAAIVKAIRADVKAAIAADEITLPEGVKISVRSEWTTDGPHFILTVVGPDALTFDGDTHSGSTSVKIEGSMGEADPRIPASWLELGGDVWGSHVPSAWPKMEVLRAGRKLRKIANSYQNPTGPKFYVSAFVCECVCGGGRVI